MLAKRNLSPSFVNSHAFSDLWKPGQDRRSGLQASINQSLSNPERRCSPSSPMEIQKRLAAETAQTIHTTKKVITCSFFGETISATLILSVVKSAKLYKKLKTSRRRQDVTNLTTSSVIAWAWVLQPVRVGSERPQTALILGRSTTSHCIVVRGYYLLSEI